MTQYINPANCMSCRECGGDANFYLTADDIYGRYAAYNEVPLSEAFYCAECFTALGYNALHLVSANHLEYMLSAIRQHDEEWIEWVEDLGKNCDNCKFGEVDYQQEPCCRCGRLHTDNWIPCCAHEEYPA